MKEEVEKLLKEAILKLKKDEKRDFVMPEIEVDYTKNEIFGDYSTNVAMKLGRGMKKDPIKIAEKIVDQLNSCHSEQSEESRKNIVNDNRQGSLPTGRQASTNAQDDNLLFQKVQAMKPGYINFYLSDKYLQEKVEEINKLGKKYGDSQIGNGEKIHLDFVSANPTGPVTLGNGRGGTLGDVLANILEKVGYVPYREYYVNDFGNQIKVLGHSIIKDSEAQYKGEYIDELAKKIRVEDPFEIGQAGAKIILEEIIKPSMKKIGITFDNYFSEKSLHDSGEVKKVFEDFMAKDYFYESEGAVWFRAEKFGDEKDRVVKKSTGEVTYFGTDIAYHKNKFERGFKRAINVWGADHHGDVKRVLGVVETLGYEGKLKIIISQLLKVIKDGKEFRMSKRKGTYISIDDLLEEVGRDAVRFFFLMYSADTHMTFDLDIAKDKSEKNPVYYVQYAHARISSILRKSEILNPKSETNSSPEADQPMAEKSKIQNTKQKNNSSLLVDEKELNLIRELNKFPELIEEIAESYEVHRLPYYAIKLADKFHSFYNDCRVIDADMPELTSARLELVKAVRIVLEETLRLIGVSAPNKM